ncbi:MAG: CPBP family intramembrane metalloprotease [Planctomycetes bacterium]|nr:CPBP family intramembrane metalloprotease [Planctomycetota bacterium]
MLSRLFAALHRRTADVRAHPLVTWTLLALATWIVTVASDKPKAIAYLAACIVCALVADALTSQPADGKRGETTAGEPRLRVESPRTEFLVLCAFAAFAAPGMYAGFGVFDGLAPRPLLVALRIVGLLCLMQVVPILWLVIRSYRAPALGLRWTGVRAALACVAVVAVTALSVDLDDAPIVKGARAGAWTELALLVALPSLQVFAEEVLRLTLQTRIAALTKNAALGWLLATLPWALLHIPKWIDNGDPLEGALGGALRIVPIGLMWGFLTWRTGSIVPALLAHQLNVFGLQNP